MITTVTSLKLIYSSNKIGIRASGLMGSHYSPNARVLLNELASPGDGLLAMADIPTPNGVTRLASPKNVEQYARELYEALRSGDQMGIQRIIVIPPEGDGIAEAVRDRLLKASSR
jgi:L-threonylcarbamoyladenylate synthase